MLKILVVATCLMTSDMQYPDCAVGLSMPSADEETCQVLLQEKKDFFTGYLDVHHPGSKSVVNLQCVDFDREKVKVDMENLGQETVRQMMKLIKDKKDI